MSRAVELDRLRQSVGGSGDPFAPAIAFLAERGINNVYPDSIGHFRHGATSGIIIGDRLVAADLLARDSVRDKDKFFLKMGKIGMRVQGFNDIDFSKGLPLPANEGDMVKPWAGFSYSVAQELGIAYQSLVRLNKVARADLVYEEPNMPAFVRKRICELIETYLDRSTPPLSFRQKNAARIKANWDGDIRSFYRLLYDTDTTTVASLGPDESVAIALYYDQRLLSNSHLTSVDKIMVEAIKARTNPADTAKEIAEYSDVPISEKGVMSYKKLLVSGSSEDAEQQDQEV